MQSRNRISALAVSIIGLFLASASATPQTNNDAFLDILARLPSASTFYNCKIEVAFEDIERDCKQECRRRIFVRFLEPSFEEGFLAGIYMPRHANFTEAREYFYLEAPYYVRGVPRISGTIQTGADGAVLSLRLKFSQNNQDKYVWCRGLVPKPFDQRRDR